ncbi:MAG: OmpA family protein [Bacteroidetes bacterium]|nr:OmpA family protein [Bacteroidota bacterium]
MMERPTRVRQYLAAPLNGGTAAARMRYGVLLLAAIAMIAGCGGGTRAVRIPTLTPDQVRTLPVTLTPLDDINSAADDFGVAMPLDTTIIYFTSGRDGAKSNQSIFYSRWKDGRWNTPALAVELNNERAIGVPTVTPGGETIYFSGEGFGFGDCDLYRADAGPRGTVSPEATPWTVPENAGMRINSVFWDSEPCIAADGSILYFSSNRPGGLGGRDIWFCRRARDGSWDAPINAGEAINTAEDEVTPWLSPDNNTLFFSSNGRPSLGGFDVFAAVMINGTTHVRHLGIPINSDHDDICFSLSSNGREAFMASNRPGGRGGFDIYRVAPVPTLTDPMTVVRGIVRNHNGVIIPATIDVHDLASAQQTGSFNCDPETGEYAIVLPRGHNYALTAHAPGYLFNSQQVLVSADLEHSNEERVDFTLSPINGTVRLLVFFAPDQSNLQKESRTDLDHVVRFLLVNPTLNVEIAGHTDNSGDANAAVALSRDRAQAVKSYLVANRVPADRITVKGYGAAQPIADNTTEGGRAMNRRVELRVLEPK